MTDSTTRYKSSPIYSLPSSSPRFSLCLKKEMLEVREVYDPWKMGNVKKIQ
ncbi:hypothetical protein GCM10010917_06170 [Paenibacillus physcomitrellae]|uniref:Berberine/berberine-like domain-containing protein n=1 Tax=Paenibacillus physcomitrellae TaxID=1619311 RepID=A0ABQ1FNN1_9BACL|nr:hypothetical protein GCM10010917_06170 [Paenibacillus physcomitrellae]